MNTTNAIKVDNIINPTLVILIALPLSIVLIKGLKSPPNIKNVNNTTIWATVLFSFFNPEFNAKIIAPKTTGIRAVGE